MKISKTHQHWITVVLVVLLTGSWITYLIFYAEPEYPEMSKEQLVQHLENRQVQQIVLVLREEGAVEGKLEIRLVDEALPENYTRSSGGVFFATSNAHYIVTVENFDAFSQDLFSYFNAKGVSGGFDYTVEIRHVPLYFRLFTSVTFFLLFFFSYIFPVLVGIFILYFGLQYLRNQRKANEPSPLPAKQDMLKVPVRSADKILLLPPESVAAFYARHNYVYAYHQDGTEYLAEQTLAQLQEKLPAHFIRVHRSSIVNIHYVQSIDKEKGGKYMITLNDLKNKQIQVSQSYGHTIRQMTAL